MLFPEAPAGLSARRGFTFSHVMASPVLGVGCWVLGDGCQGGAFNPRTFVLRLNPSKFRGFYTD